MEDLDKATEINEAVAPKDVRNRIIRLTMEIASRCISEKDNNVLISYNTAIAILNIASQYDSVQDTNRLLNAARNIYNNALSKTVRKP